MEMRVEKADGMSSMKRIIISLVLLPALISCVQKATPEIHTPEGDEQGEYKSVMMVIPPMSFEDNEPETKIGLDLNSLKYLWTDKDSVGIFPDKGSQIYFSMAEGAGQSTATFEGGGWALKKGSSYYSYFPFIADYYSARDEIPISFKGQVQEGNGNLSNASLGKQCFMVAKGIADENTGNLMFTFERLQMPFMFIIPVEAGTYTSLDVYAGEKLIAVSGTMNAVSLDKVINNAVYDDHLSIDLKNISFTSDEKLIAVAMLPPFDIYGKQLTLNLTKDDGTIVTSSVFGKTYSLGKAYRNSPNFSVSPASMNISGDAGTLTIQITATGTGAYSVASDSDWITIIDAPVSGSATITANVLKNTGKERTGHIIISESVTYKETTITLQNKVKILQDMNGMSVDIGKWDNAGEDLGGTAE